MPGAGTKAAEYAPMPQLLLKVFKPASPNLLSMLPPVYPAETTIKALIPSPILTAPDTFLCPPTPLPGDSMLSPFFFF